MATAEKLNYLNETKNQIRKAIEDENLATIDTTTTFREYAKKIKSTNEEIKKYVPTDIIEGTSLNATNAAPLNAKSLIIDGNIYQKNTKGINLFNYLENINSVTGLNITADGDYIVVNGTTSNNYPLIIKDIDLTDIFEDGITYTLWQENDSKSSSSSTFPKTAIRLHRKDIDGNSSYIRTSSKNMISFKIDKAAYPNYFVDVVAPTSGEMYSDYRNRFMILKGEYTEDRIPNFEPYTGGIASPNPVFPQKIEVIENINLSNNDDNYSIDLQGNFIGKINDVKDELNISTGVLTKKIGLKILNGTENWKSVSAYENYYRYSLDIVDENLKSDIVDGVYSLNTHFYNRNKSSHGDYEYLYVQANSSGGIIYIQSKKWDTITEFKEWLSQNNVIVCYKLTTPKMLQLEPIKIKMYEGTNNIELISNLETEMTLEYYKTNEEVLSEVTE